MPVRADRLRTLIWTPDASRGLATLGNTPDAYGQTWHLPVWDERLTYRQFVDLAADVFGQRADYAVIPKWLLSASGLFSAQAREIRNSCPAISTTTVRLDEVRDALPDFAITSYREGLTAIGDEAADQRP